MLNKFFVPILFVIAININAYSQSNLGNVTFKPEGKEVAQPYFIKGLLLLHSFEYTDAIEQFQMAQMLDPDFIMAYWGEALCYYYPLWHSQNYEMGKGTLMKLGIFEDDRLALAKNEMERDLLKSVEELFKEMKPQASRVNHYNLLLEQLHTKYSGDIEISAFYALSLIGRAKQESDEQLFITANDICKQILKTNPSHPGALNYIIYADENPERATNALNEAKQYGIIASGSEHALHAGSHIFVSLGLWEENIASNSKSWEASEKRVVSKKLSLEDRNYHALWWLQYGYLQRGQLEKAEGMVQDMYLDARMSDSKLTRYHLVSMKTAYLINSENWNSKVSESEVPTRGLNITTKICDLLAKGLKAYHTNDFNRLKYVSGQITDMLSIERNKSSLPGDEIFMQCGSDLMRSESSPLDIKLSEIMEMEMLALVAMAENNYDKANELMIKACEEEAKAAFIGELPLIVKPSFELYGELLLKQSKPDEAVNMYNKSLEMYPNRSLSLRGKYIGLKNSGNSAEAAKVKSALLKNWKLADTNVKSVIN
jgi:tetratricopeptide (TPR) repeat protein